jgi:hypothetical protein
MKHSAVFGIVASVSLLMASTAFADVQLTMQNGRVTIKAKDATLRQIMTEWARVGQTKIVNIERIPGGPMTIELNNVPEEQALSTLMKSLSGYVAAPRTEGNPGASRFDRILVMPTVAAARQATTAGAGPTPPTATPPTFQPPQPFPPPSAAANEVVEDDEPPAQTNPVATPRAPVFTAFPQPQVVVPNPAGMNSPAQAVPFPQQPAAAPAQQAAPSAVPTMPAGVAVPGMMVPVPQQPGAQPQAPGTIRRPGGQ